MKIDINNVSKYLIYTATIGLAVSYGNFYLFHIFIVMFMATAIVEIKNVVKTIDFLNNLPIILIFSFQLLYIFSITWSNNKLSAIYYSAYIFIGILLILTFIIAAKNQIELDKIFKIISYIFIVEIIVSLLEIITTFRYPISPYSSIVEYFNRENKIFENFSPHFINSLATIPTGFRWNPNDLATTMIIILPFFVIHKNLIIKFLGVLGVVAIIYFTNSRTVLFCVLFLFFLYILLYEKIKTKLIFFGSMLFIVIIIVLNLNNLNKYEKFIPTKITYTINSIRIFLTENHEKINEKSSISIRQNLIKNAFTAFKQSYGLGVGGGNSNFIHKQKNMKNTKNITSLHNFWLEILVEGGIIAFLIFIYFYFSTIYKVFVISKKTENETLMYYAKASTLALSIFIIAEISMSSAIYFLPMWLLLGFSLSLSKIYKL